MLDVFTGRAAPDGGEAARAGLMPQFAADEPGQHADLRAVLVPPANERTTVMLPLGGALGAAAQEGLALTDPSAGAEAGVAYTLDGLDRTVCPAGQFSLVNTRDAKPCALDRVERPGTGGTVWLTGHGTRTATLPSPVAGTLLLDISADPRRQPTTVDITAGGITTRLTAEDLAVAPAERWDTARTVPYQAQIPVADATEITVAVDGAIYLDDVVVVP